jgi:hypothetical protein
MNIANYSPYNKSYRFLCFQNKAYHEKNKKNMSPTVKTNLKYFMNSASTNPESFIEVFFTIILRDVSEVPSNNLGLQAVLN